MIKKNKTKKVNFIIDEPKEEISSLKSDTTVQEYSDLLEEISVQLRKIQTSQLNQVKHIVTKEDIDHTALLIEDLIPILDSLERTLDLAKTFSDNDVLSNWIKNIDAIYRKLRAVLNRQGLRDIDSIGKKVDFNKHEVVEYLETNEFPDNIIIGEKQRGYLFRDKVIRDAKVIVAKSIAKP